VPTDPSQRIAVSALPRKIADQAMLRSLRTTDHAMRVVAALDPLTDRLWSDPYTKQNGSRVFYRRDPDRPGWLFGSLLVDWLLDATPPAPARFDDSVPRHIVDAYHARMGARAQPEGPNQRPGRLILCEGETRVHIHYDGTGRIQERSGYQGPGPHGDDDPYYVDPSSPNVRGPLSLLCRADLDEHGHEPAEFAAFIAAMRPPTEVRLFIPAPIPGGAMRAGWRAIEGYNRASGSGSFVAPAAGWIVADGVTGDALAWGATFEQANQAFDELMQRGVAPPPPPPDEPTEEEIAKLMSGASVAPRATKDDDVTHIALPPMLVTFRPPRDMPWPALTPETVPRAAFPVPERPPVPARLAAAGFTRAVQYLEEDARTAHHAYLRHEPGGGWTLVGEAVVDHVDLTTLDALYAQTLRTNERELVEVWGRTDRHPDYTWTVIRFKHDPAAGGLTRGGFSLAPQRAEVWEHASVSAIVSHCARR
jgi:hypothetical protein